MKKAVGFVLSLIIGSMLYAVPSYANECNAASPCHTYAEVDSSGVVVNIIVCQTSVCGENGEWKGKNPNNGNRLVAQVAANPQTHQSQGGYYNPVSSGTNIVTESNGTFTVHKDTPVIKNNIVEINESETALITTIVQSDNSLSFRFEDTVGKTSDEIVMNVVDLPIDTDAIIKISIGVFDTNTASLIQDSNTTSEKIYENVFSERKNVQELEQQIVENNIDSKYYRTFNTVFPVIVGMLGRWLIAII
jgi:hypothetical protein